MKHLLPLAAALAAALPASAAFLDFDGVPSGTLAKDVAPPGLGIEPAIYLPDYDEFGDPIPGTDKWRVDVLAPPLTIENPEDYGRGPAPSPEGALNALFQPTLLITGGGDWLSFSVTLDNDTFGDPWIEILLLDAAGGLLGTLPTDQTVPGLVASFSGPLPGISQILLPAGAFYDNLTVVVPEGDTALVGLGLAALAAWGWRRTRRA